jgi:hypothetical protein
LKREPALVFHHGFKPVALQLHQYDSTNIALGFAGLNPRLFPLGAFQFTIFLVSFVWMEIVNLIAELLYKHNCVIVPGFGGFIANTKEASITQDGRLTKPPRKQLVFNQSLQENDGLLVNALAKRQSMDYERALHDVEFFVKFIGDRLKAYKNYELKNIGSFYLNAEGKLIFIPYDGANFHMASYGLPTIKVKPLRPIVKTEKVVQPVETAEPQENVSKTSTIRWANMAAALAVIVVAAGLAWKTLLLPIANPQSVSNEKMVEPQTASVLSENTFEDTNRSDGEAELQTPEQELVEQLPSAVEESDAADSIASEVEISMESVEDETDRTASRTPVDSLKTVYEEHMAPKSMYYIVVDLPSSAQKSYIQNLERRAFTPYIMQGSKPDEEIICLEKFTNLERAREYLSIVIRYDEKNARILEKLN